MNVRLSLSILWLSLAPAFFLTAAEEVLPESFSPDRYAAMKQSSPFALATPVVEQAEPNFARDMFISGVARIGQKNLVSITTQDKSKTYTLMTGDPPIEGMALVDVNWNRELGKTTVQITKGVESATLQFNEMAIRAPAAMTAVPPPQPNRPGVSVPQAGGPRVPQPGIPRVINTPAASGGDGARPRRRLIRRPSR